MDEALSLSSYLVFNTVARNGNLSGAAKELLISQPAVSKSLQRLEEGLSVKLFVRNSRGVRLTDEGEILYEHTRPAFDSLAQAERALKAYSASGTESIKLGVSSNLCKHLFTPRLKEIIEAHPMYKLDLRIATSFELMDAVERGELDLALITKPISVHRLEFREMYELRDITVASPSYLAFLQNANMGLGTSNIIEKARFLLPPKSSCTGSIIYSYLSEANINPGAVTETDSIDSCLDFALSGLGITVLPELFAGEHIKKGALVELPNIVSDSRHTAGIIYEKTTSQRISVMSLVHTMITEEKV